MNEIYYLLVFSTEFRAVFVHQFAAHIRVARYSA